MLKVNSVSVSAGDFKLDKISFNIAPQKTHVIIGATGSGKTLILESIIGFRKINSGNIIIDNKNTSELNIENRNIAYVPQDLALFPHLNVEKNILFSQKINKTKNYNPDLKKQLVKATGISDLLKRKIKNLSGGEKQRVALVRALLSESKLLILDEPFSAINETTKKELRFLLKEIQQKFKLTILFVTHDLGEAFFIADTISIISNGKILKTADKRELYNNPELLEIANFLGINNIFEALITEINKNYIFVNCFELKTKLQLNNLPTKKSYKIGKLVKFGIRASDVMILRNDLINKEQTNILSGTVSLIIENISFCEIVIKPENSYKNIIAEIPIYAFNKLKIKLNQKINFTLKAENIFLLK